MSKNNSLKNKMSEFRHDIIKMDIYFEICWSLHVILLLI